MNMEDDHKNFLNAVEESVRLKKFIKLSIKYDNNANGDLKQLYVRCIQIKQEDKLSFTLSYKTKDITKNYSIGEGMALLEGDFIGHCRSATLSDMRFNLQLERIRDRAYRLKKQKATHSTLPSLTHDRKKARIIDQKKYYLHALGLTDSTGNVFSRSQDKYKQINQFINLLAVDLKRYKKQELTKVVDMGAGKGYLTFALYDYLHNELKHDVFLTGVEIRQDLVEKCNNIARASNFTGLRFQQGYIGEYEAGDVDLLVALHACDTATDDAIFQGLSTKASMIVVAPCCHKEVRQEMERVKHLNQVSILTRYGIFMERQAEMLTDGLRALILEYYGYKVKVFEFVSDVHTPKNVLIVASYGGSQTSVFRKAIYDKINKLRSDFGITTQRLYRLCFSENG